MKVKCLVQTTGFRNYNVFNELFNLISLLSPYLIPMYLLDGLIF